MGFISSLFGGDSGDSDDTTTNTTANNNSQNSGMNFSNWLKGSNSNMDPAATYAANFIYNPAQNTGQYNNGNTNLGNLAQGMVSSQYNTISGYAPIQYQSITQPRQGLYGSLADLYRG